MGKIQKTYTVEEKLQAVKMYEDRGLGYKAVAKNLGIGDSLVRRWVKHYQVEGLEGLKESEEEPKGFKKDDLELSHCRWKKNLFDSAPRMNI